MAFVNFFGKCTLHRAALIRKKYEAEYMTERCELQPRKTNDPITQTTRQVAPRTTATNSKRNLPIISTFPPFSSKSSHFSIKTNIAALTTNGKATMIAG
mmetsp:Transcript_5635/g.11176  ORF Transcript_5635/g.11176 Transcript_5635/m.11176 type:complete len:99 (-) Transcript_5635:698-994(-)